MACNTCCTLGGESFNPVGVAGGPVNKTSTNNKGRHGASNLWGQWPKRGSRAGITARAPYNIGVPKTPVTMGGTGHHNTGLGLGLHGHGVGVVPSALGGPHNARRGSLSVSLGNKGKAGGKTLTISGGICPRCFATWLLVGAAVVAILIVRR